MAWLRGKLLEVICTDMETCSVAEGVSALELLELFERVSGEAFYSVPAGPLRLRQGSIAKVMGNLFAEASSGAVVIDPPLVREMLRGRMQYNRRPKIPGDVSAWLQATKDAEMHSVHRLSARDAMAEADAGLAAWIKGHRYLQPVDVEDGESGLALLLLWEVDHGRPYPRQGGQAAVLHGFANRLSKRIQEDAELRTWLTSRYCARPLAPGFPVNYHSRWSVRVVQPAPSEPQGWYDEFVARWRALLVSQQQSSSKPAAAAAAAALAATQMEEPC